MELWEIFQFVIGYAILLPLLLGFWFWMMMDCQKRPSGKFAIGGKYAKQIWVLVIVLPGIFGALLYYFLIKRKD